MQIGTEPSDNQYLVVDIGLAVGTLRYLLIKNDSIISKCNNRKPNFSMTEAKYFQAVPILLIGNTAPHDVLVKRKPTRNVIKTFAIIDCVLFYYLKSSSQKIILTFKKTSSFSNMKFYFLSLRIKIGSLTSINISLCGNCILKF